MSLLGHNFAMKKSVFYRKYKINMNCIHSYFVNKNTVEIFVLLALLFQEDVTKGSQFMSADIW